MDLTDREVKAVFNVCYAEIAQRRRYGTPIPEWLRHLYGRLDNAVRYPEHADHQNNAQSELIDARAAATILGTSEREVRRIASSLDGRLIGRQWVFQRAAVTEYANNKGRE